MDGRWASHDTAERKFRSWTGSCGCMPGARVALAEQATDGSWGRTEGVARRRGVAILLSGRCGLGLGVADEALEPLLDGEPRGLHVLASREGRRRLVHGERCRDSEAPLLDLSPRGALTRNQIVREFDSHPEILRSPPAPTFRCGGPGR